MSDRRYKRGLHKPLTQRVALFAICVAAFFIRANPVRALGDMSLADIEAAIHAYEAAIDTLAGTYTSRMYRDPEAPAKPLKPTSVRDALSECTFVSDITRGRTAIEEERENWLHALGGEPIHGRFLRRFDGVRSYVLIHIPDAPVHSEAPPGVPHQTQTTPLDSTRIHYLPENFAALRLKGPEVTLASYLRLQSGRLDGIEEINGVDCYKLVVDDEDTRYVAWLDPTHDFLPARQEYFLLQETEPPKRLHRLDNVEFKQFPNAARGESRWFPTKSSALSWVDTRTDIRISKIRLNPPVADEQIRIDPADLPHGVRIDDGSAKLTYTGGRKDIWLQRQEQLSDQEKTMRKQLGIVDPSQSDPVGPRVRVQAHDPISTLRWVIMSVSLLVIALGVLALVRRRSQGHA